MSDGNSTNGSVPRNFLQHLFVYINIYSTPESFILLLVWQQLLPLYYSYHKYLNQLLHILSTLLF